MQDNTQNPAVGVPPTGVPGQAPVPGSPVVDTPPAAQVPETPVVPTPPASPLGGNDSGVGTPPTTPPVTGGTV